MRYLDREPALAYNLFIRALNSWKKDQVFAGSLAAAVLTILLRIPLTDELLAAAIDLVKRLPRSRLSWERLAEVWRRRDLTDVQRGFFYDDVAC
jgi:hypothetical protein